MLGQRIVCQGIPRLHITDHNFGPVEKPFAVALRITVDANETAVARHAKDLNDGPNLILARQERPPLLADAYTITDVKQVILRLYSYCIHGVHP
jgi:hypothetical protein